MSQIQLSILRPPPGWSNMRCADWRSHRIGRPRPGHGKEVIALKRRSDTEWAVYKVTSAESIQANGGMSWVGCEFIAFASDLGKVRTIMERLCD